MINVSVSKVIKPVWGWQRNCSRHLWILLPSSIHFSPGCGAPSCCYYLELMVKMMVQRLSHHGREHSGQRERNCIQVTPFVLNLVTWFFFSTYVSLNWFCHLKWRMKTDRRIDRQRDQESRVENSETDWYTRENFPSLDILQSLPWISSQLLVVSQVSGPRLLIHSQMNEFSLVVWSIYLHMTPKFIFPVFVILLRFRPIYSLVHQDSPLECINESEV